jgi:hypothetical protein
MIAGGDGSRRAWAHYVPVVDIAAVALAVSLWMLAAAPANAHVVTKTATTGQKNCAACRACVDHSIAPDDVS